MTLTIDLRAPSLADGRRVWRLFPGNGYQFLPSFREGRLAFLDLPGFLMPPGDLSTATDLVARLAHSQEIRAQLYEHGRDHEPAADLQHFRTARRTKSRGRIRQAIINLFSQARAGDLLVVPSALSVGEIHIGRFADNTISRTTYQHRYGNTQLPARNVDWLNSVDEGAISAQFRKSLRHQHPFALLETNYWIEVFALTYSSFVFRGTHVSTVFNESDYTDADASFLGNVTKLASAAVHALEDGRRLDPNDLLEILLSSPSEDFTSSQQIDIHSPGFNRYVGGSIAVLVTAALVAAFMVLPTDRAQLAPAVAQMTVMNTAPDSDPQCTARVHEAQKLVFEMLDIDRTLKLCEAARRAQTRGGLRSSATSTR